MLDGQIIKAGTIFESAPPISKEILDVARALGTTNTAAALGGPLSSQLLLDGHAVPRVTGRGVVAGTAVTVWNPPGSNGMVIHCLGMLRADDVVVMEGCHETGQWGDQATAIAVSRGVTGAVVDGAVRDLERIDEMGFSLWGSRVFGRQGLHKDFGFINGPVKVGGLVVRPGDLVVADRDGILAVPTSLIPLAYERAQERLEREAEALEYSLRGEIAPVLRDGASFEVTEELGVMLRGGIEHAGMTWHEWSAGQPSPTNGKVG